MNDSKGFSKDLLKGFSFSFKYNTDGFVKFLSEDESSLLLDSPCRSKSLSSSSVGAMFSGLDISSLKSVRSSMSFSVSDFDGLDSDECSDGNMSSYSSLVFKSFHLEFVISETDSDGSGRSWVSSGDSEKSSLDSSGSDGNSSEDSSESDDSDFD